MERTLQSVRSSNRRSIEVRGGHLLQGPLDGVQAALHAAAGGFGGGAQRGDAGLRLAQGRLAGLLPPRELLQRLGREVPEPPRLTARIVGAGGTELRDGRGCEK